ncbi:hypothetical protein K3495_g3045 [Podosphaera aphanis]|nr:hypothetical protein K3495_g3045 [Podosphaera aphanis]
MPPVRKNRPPTSTAIGKERARTCPKQSGLAQNLKSVVALEACLQGKSPNLPDAEMIDAEPLSSSNHGPVTTQNSEQAAEVASSIKGKEVVRDKTSQSADPSARKIAVPVSKRTAATEASVYPPELQAVLEAEKRRATRIKAHLSICSTAINSVEAALSPLSTVRAHGPRIDTAKSSRSSLLPSPIEGPPKRAPTPAAPQEQNTKSTWATVARNGLCHSAGPPSTKQVPIPRKTKKSISKTKVDKRLFLRLAKEDAWRNASPSFLQQKISAMAAIPLANISLVQRVKTGFAITTTEETSRKKILDLVLQKGRRFQPASNLVAYLIPTVPVKSNSPTTSVSRTVEMVTQEIVRVSDAVPSLVRPQGLTTIRQYSQREYAAVARVKGAAERAEITPIAASKDAPMSEGTGFQALNSEEEA